MSQVIPFQFDTVSIRAVEIGGEPWFVGKDVAEALGYVDATTAIRNHCKGVPKQHPLATGGGTQQVRILSEPDVLRLIVSSTLPEAVRFERWVFEEVMPTLRRTGQYGVKDKSNVTTLQPVRDLLRIGQAVSRVKGVDPAMAMAYTLAAIEKSTGLPATELRRALPAVESEDLAVLNATAVGEALGLGKGGAAARAANKILAAAGLQTKTTHGWELTKDGEGAGQAKPFHRNGHSGYEISWKSGVVDLLRAYLDSAEAAA